LTTPRNLELLLFLLTLVSWIYWLVAWWWVRGFFQSESAPDLGFTPPASILKAVKGRDAQAYENFASFCRQDYPNYELLFGVSEARDPVVPIVRRLQQNFPERNIRFFVAPAIGPNQKASTLHQLAAKARYGLLVASDSDMRVRPDYLRQVVAPLADDKVGLVTCPFRGELPLTMTARLEALHMGVTFLPSVLVARRVLSMRFALGASAALRRPDLERLGGYAALAGYLADDYQLGVRLAKLGLRVHLSSYVMDSVLGPTNFREQWNREVRWAHCNRVSRPWEYPGLLITFSTPLATILLLASGFALSAWLVLLISLLLRWWVAWKVTGYIRDEDLRRWLGWLPVRDMLSALIWCAGAVSRRVVWRDQTYVLRAGGRLEALQPANRPRVLARAICGLDAMLRRLQHIEEFSQAEGCLLRLATRTSDRDLILSDGTQVGQGDPVGELHFWNEHMPRMPAGGPDLAWALAFQRRMVRSLRELAVHVATAPLFQPVSAFRGELIFGSRFGLGDAVEVIQRWGFDLVESVPPAGRWGQFVAFWEHLYTLALIWAYNPASLKGKRIRTMKRDQLWISRSALFARYGSSCEMLEKEPAKS
jgi:ceramide glucosyltransferase